MARVTVENCLEHIPNRFELVLAATRRARRLITGEADPSLELDQDKMTVVALREIEEKRIDKMGRELPQSPQPMESASMVNPIPPILSTSVEGEAPPVQPIPPVVASLMEATQQQDNHDANQEGDE